MATILLLDDDEGVRLLFLAIIQDAGYRVLIGESGAHALRLLKLHPVDIVLTDLFMPDMDGLELIPQIRQTCPSCKIIAVSGGSGEWDFLTAAQSLGANDALHKPIPPQLLLDTIAAQLK